MVKKNRMAFFDADALTMSSCLKMPFHFIGLEKLKL